MNTCNDPFFESFKAPPPHQKILGIGGSPREGGNSDILLKHIFHGACQSDIPGQCIHLRDYQYQSCLGCECCRKKAICTGQSDGMSLLYPGFLESQGLILVSPTHNYNITALMKAFIDRLYCFYVFDNHRPRRWTSSIGGQGRKAVLAAICEQGTKKDMGFTLDAMRLPLQDLGYEIVGELPVYNIYDKAKVINKKEALLKATKLGEDLARSLAAETLSQASATRGSQQ